MTTPVVFTQTRNDAFLDSPARARNIGKLEADKTRLTLFSGLARNDRVDFYRFEVTSDIKNVTIGQRGTDIRVQILDRSGRNVIADSSTLADRRLQDVYKEAQSGNLELKKGTYLVKVERAPGTLNSVTPSYVIQIFAGKFRQDFDTREFPSRVEDAVPASTTTTLFDVLTIKSTKENRAGLNIFNYFA